MMPRQLKITEEGEPDKNPVMVGFAAAADLVYGLRFG